MQSLRSPHSELNSFLSHNNTQQHTWTQPCRLYSAAVSTSITIIASLCRSARCSNVNVALNYCNYQLRRGASSTECNSTVSTLLIMNYGAEGDNSRCKTTQLVIIVTSMRHNTQRKQFHRPSRTATIEPWPTEWNRSNWRNWTSSARWNIWVQQSQQSRLQKISYLKRHGREIE